MNGQDSLLHDPFAKFNLLKDSNLMVQYYIMDTESGEAIDRTNLPEDFHQADPGWRNGLAFGNLGNFGSSAKPLLYDAVQDITFTLGFFAFDIYNLKNDYAHFVKGERPYSKVYYSQGGGQDNFIFRGEYSRALSKTVLFSIDYQRISNLGFYVNQKTRHTGLTMALWYHGPKNRYDLWLAYGNNFNNQQDNGGVTTDTLFDETIYQQRDAIPVKLTKANTRYTSYKASIGQNYSLIKPGTAGSSVLTLIHRSKWVKQTIKFADPVSNADFYGIFNTYPNGLRYFTTNTGIYNYGGIRLGLSSGANALSIEPGVSFNKFDVKLDTSGFVWSELWLQTKVTGNVGVFNVKANGQYGFADNKENYRIDLLGQTSIGKWADASARLILQKYPGTTMNYVFHISKIAVWDQDLKKIDEQALYLNLKINPLNLRVFSNQFSINNYVYFDTSGYPRQVDGNFQIAQVGLAHDLKLWKFHLVNMLTYQTKNSDYVRLPQWVSQHSFYFEGRVFNKSLYLRPGVNLRYISSYYADNYMPASGQFILQNKVKLKEQLLWDIFFDFKVKNFQAFIKMENVGKWFSPVVNYFVPLYPLPEAKFRFGIQWQFLN